MGTPYRQSTSTAGRRLFGGADGSRRSARLLRRAGGRRLLRVRDALSLGRIVLLAGECAASSTGDAQCCYRCDQILVHDNLAFCLSQRDSFFTDGKEPNCLLSHSCAATDESCHKVSQVGPSAQKVTYAGLQPQWPRMVQTRRRQTLIHFSGYRNAVSSDISRIYVMQV